LAASSISDILFSTGKAAEKRAMLGRHLAGVGGIRCLLLVCVLFGSAAEKETLEFHLAGVGGISCLIIVVFYW
jgi:hypothetical protein